MSIGWGRWSENVVIFWTHCNKFHCPILTQIGALVVSSISRLFQLRRWIQIFKLIVCMDNGCSLYRVPTVQQKSYSIFCIKTYCYFVGSNFFDYSFFRVNLCSIIVILLLLLSWIFKWFIRFCSKLTFKVLTENIMIGLRKHTI